MIRIDRALYPPFSGPCAETDPELFFPGKGESSTGAKALCATCPVRTECLDFAITTSQRYGVWGGMSERERRREAANRGLHAQPGPQPRRPHGTTAAYRRHLRYGETPCPACAEASRVDAASRHTRSTTPSTTTTTRRTAA